MICIVEIIKPIVRLDYDNSLSITSAELYNDIPVNFNHMCDSEIGRVLGVYVDDKDKNLIVARMDIKDEVWNKYSSRFGGCSVEASLSPKKDVVIPTRVSILTKDVEPAIEDTKNFTLQKYSKDEQQYIKSYYSWEEQNKKEESININEVVREIIDAVKNNYSFEDNKTKGDDIMSEEKYTEIMNKIGEFESKYSEVLKEKEELESKYSKEIESIKSEYSDTMNKYKEEIEKMKSEIESIKSEYSDGVSTVKEELNTIKEKYGLVEGDDMSKKEEYESNSYICEDW